MATKPPLPPPAAAAALPHTALPPSPQPRGCPPRPFPRIPVAVSPLCAAHTPSPTTTCVLTLRHDDFSPSWAILKSSLASQPTQTPTMYQWSIGYAGGGSGSCVDGQDCLYLPSTDAISVYGCIVDPLSGIQITPTFGFVVRDHNNPQSVFGLRRRGVVFVLRVKWGRTLRWAFAFHFTWLWW